MTALRWFLSYLLPMLIIVSIAAAFFYREQLTNNWYHTLSWPVTQINLALQQQKLQLDGVKPTEASLPSPQHSVAAKPDTETPSSDAQAITAIKSRQEQVLVKPIKSATKSETPDSSPKKNTEAEQLICTPQGKQYYLPYPKHVMRPPMSRAPLPAFNRPSFNRVPKSAPLPPTKFKLSKVQRNLLYQARQDFWKKNNKKAKKQYLTLAKQLPDNPDIQGELGNIFYLEHKMEKAIKHYSLAAKLLIKHRHFWKLPQIMNIVAHFNPDKAVEIMKLLRGKNKVTQNSKSPNIRNQNIRGKI